ncbi:hypothetical protein H8R20_18165 [Morganella morganii]|uniref:hypothetical protein n=1 Tax=Morganella morganii TaxID=582 RepID=UPI0016452ECF|nr:hypothetical protein [Morganella morganii]MBC3997513.1 hypothetical protein [Morganella morganii]
MKTITVTQSMADLVKNSGKKYSPVYEEYIRILPRKSQLPRGKYFKGRVAGPVTPLIDEFGYLCDLSPAMSAAYKAARNY